MRSRSFDTLNKHSELLLLSPWNGGVLRRYVCLHSACGHALPRVAKCKPCADHKHLHHVYGWCARRAIALMALCVRRFIANTRLSFTHSLSPRPLVDDVFASQIAFITYACTHSIRHEIGRISVAKRETYVWQCHRVRWTLHQREKNAQRNLLFLCSMRKSAWKQKQ